MKKLFASVCFIISMNSLSAQWTTGSNLIYYNGGNVGIGTSNPAALLHGFSNTSGHNTFHSYFENINESGRTQCLITTGSFPNNFLGLMTHGTNFGDDNYLNDNTNDAGLGLIVGQGSNMTKLSVGTFDARPLSLFSNNTERVYIKPTGEVGIGTTNPQFKLHVAGLSNPPAITLGVDAASGGYTALITELSAVSDGYAKLQGIKSSGTAWGDIILNPSGGNIGIGTTNPGPYKLAVEGILGARKVKVTQATPWADYVFHSTYRLRPLSEVEQYIQQYHHLPEVPSAEEVAKDGLDIGDNQATLLKKIEELTLYAIEQHKKIEDLYKKLDAQNNLITELQKKKAPSK